MECFDAAHLRLIGCNRRRLFHRYRPGGAARRAATTLPWGLWIDPASRPADTPDISLYQPTFLYESLWDLGVVVLLLWAGKRFALRDGRLFALYVAAYTVGRAWVKALRVDHANHFLGLRLND